MRQFIVELELDVDFWFSSSQEDDKRTTSICESIASTVTATSEVEEVMSSEEDNGEDNADSDTTSCPSPAQQDTTEFEKGKMNLIVMCVLVIPYHVMFHAINPVALDIEC